LVTKSGLNQQSPSLVQQKKADQLKPELKLAQDSGDKSRSKRKKGKNFKTIFRELALQAEMNDIRSKNDNS
jgi:hypothetical protein